MEESHQVNAECISCSFKGSIEVKKGKKIYEMSCLKCGKKTLRKRRKGRNAMFLDFGTTRNKMMSAIE